MAHAGGRPPKYKNVEEIEEKIEQYFAICEGEPLLDDEGKQVINKYGYPCWIKAPKPPTVTGLALALGFTTRLSLLNYQAKAEFVNTITRAKTRIEEYAISTHTPSWGVTAKYCNFLRSHHQISQGRTLQPKLITFFLKKNLQLHANPLDKPNHPSFACQSITSVFP